MKKGKHNFLGGEYWKSYNSGCKTFSEFENGDIRIHPSLNILW